ncbi:MAG: hypothetical protein PCALPYG88_6079 [uncultured Paraburkholderia sp.]|uniref:hypothetical protein n=1 Tax=uncultured Paraburkholderia sp. TaxID=1822466 RepID=UPI002593741C|nr:hypothetical protein [uncultured Paraburkholderia sp.]CAH2902691.1 MAG: hypothetical protein PCALPYG08_6207 [uncultured Paraburkholderia sp.]CAH2937822.1 MAG: hypothetical protein PCALPYG88_6079 [uncultured Paraburkholderia sp.]
MTKTVRVIFAAAAIGVAAVCFPVVKHDRPSSASDTQLASFNPYPIGSPARLEQEKFLHWQMENAQLGQTALTPALPDRQRLASRLMVAGMGRLPYALLERYLPLVSKILQSLDEESCGKFIKGQLPPAQFVSSANGVIGSFDADEANTWFSVAKSAIQADLDGKPIVPTQSQQTPDDLIRLADTLPGDQRAHFLRQLRRFPTANFRDACAIARTLYSQGSRLDEPYRGRVAHWICPCTSGHRLTLELMNRFCA